jgi:hypothetical protein
MYAASGGSGCPTVETRFDTKKAVSQDAAVRQVLAELTTAGSSGSNGWQQVAKAVARAAKTHNLFTGWRIRPVAMAGGGAQVGAQLGLAQDPLQVAGGHLSQGPADVFAEGQGWQDFRLGVVHRQPLLLFLMF